MANTYTQLYIHIVFAVKYRENLIRKENREELQKFISGIITNRKQKLLSIFCMPDHCHILVSIKPDITISDLVRDIKAGSSKFINEKKWLRGKFNWQEGFSAFSCSQNHMERTILYIQNQEEHHKHGNFKKEYMELLHEFEIAYDEKYIFEFHDN